MSGSSIPIDGLPEPRRWTRRRVATWCWLAAVIAAALVLTVAIQGRDRGDGPTLRPMEASESMTDEQARAVAESTVLVWVREQAAGHQANLTALTSPEHEDRVLELMRGQTGVTSFGGFSRQGPLWNLNTHLSDGSGAELVLQVKDGELRLYRLRPAPIP